MRAIGKKTVSEKLASPFVQFAANESAGGLILVACALAAMVWANSPVSSGYFSLLNQHLAVGLDGHGILDQSIGHWINDGLMAVFFLLVGLEIKREMLVGELRTMRLAALPMMAALGGMLVPALIYLAFNQGTASAQGWGVPMATDIAFALGLLGLLGSRVPLALKVFLTALAIVDDLGAVLVIALFYTSRLDLPALGFAAGAVGFLFLLNALGVRQIVPYLLVGIVVWFLVLKSGIHATVAGIMVAAAIPAKSRLSLDEFAREGKQFLKKLESDDEGGPDDDEAALYALSKSVASAESPLHRLEHLLHPWVAFFIVPLFALANAGVPLPPDLAGTLRQPVTLGIVTGLVLGKFVGVGGFAWLAVKLRLADLPEGVSWKHITGAACLAGVGFTMSLFIAVLAFSTPESLGGAKIGILAASVIAGTVGLALLSRLKNAVTA
jgi:NhaA family Na+:H+ antiporter